MSHYRKSNINLSNSDYLSSNDKVIHYLQNSASCSKTNVTSILRKPFSNNLSIQHRLRYCSENDSMSSSSSSVVDSLGRSDISIESSLPAHSNDITSNSSAEEEFDFNIGFEQLSNDDDDDDDDDFHEDRARVFNQYNSDEITSIDQTIPDELFYKFKEFLRQTSSNSTMLKDDYEFNNDDTITSNYTKTQQQQRASFLHDPTHVLCSQNRFSAFAVDHDNDYKNGLHIRSNSLSILQFDEKSTLIDKVPKKVVHFADMWGLDLESIHYMTPPDQTITLSQTLEHVRLPLESVSLEQNSLTIPDICKQSTSFSLARKYNLVSKHFTSPINIIPLIYEKQIMLECLYTKESTAYGTIRVNNCTFEKYVFVRLTMNEWKTFEDIQAYHSMHYSFDNTDTFMFAITLPKSNNDTTIPKRILFAVSLRAMSQEFWDNNQNWNYVLDVFER